MPTLWHSRLLPSAGAYGCGSGRIPRLQVLQPRLAVLARRFLLSSGGPGTRIRRNVTIAVHIGFDDGLRRFVQAVGRASAPAGRCRLFCRHRLWYWYIAIG